MLPSGAVLFILVVALMLAISLAWLLTLFYERRMLALMRAGVAAVSAAGGDGDAPAAAPARAPPGITLAANRRANRRLTVALGAVSLLLALSQSLLALLFVYGGELSANRVLVLGAVYAWPMVLCWGLARRWSWPRVVGGVAVYLLAMLGLVMLRSNATQTIAAASGWLLSQVAIPLAMTLLIGASGRIRAVAPYLLPPVLLLTGASVLGLQIFAPSAQELPPWIGAMAGTLGAWPTLLLLFIAPCLLLAWPVVRLGRWLAAAYRRKRFSDLGYLIAVYWFLILFSSALPALQSVGWIAFVQLVPWFWLPLVAYLLSATRPPAPAAPTLLVLRVFAHDAQVERLFDEVIERWRLSGNTVLIAGTDLISRTLDPDDLFAYLNGALAERFVASGEQISERIERFDWRPDPDGRYRINDCYCFDSSWQAALNALIACSSVVLMDLRGFRPENHGCRYELRILAHADHLRRVVILHDATTARAVADADIDSAAASRFVWLSAERMDSATAARVLTALFA